MASMSQDEPSDRRDPQETARLRDEALGRLLRMPPKPHEDMKLGKPRRRVADTGERPDSAKMRGAPSAESGRDRG